MKASSGKLIITPPIGLPIGGNVRDDNISRGVHDDLFCAAILLEDAGRVICLLSLDLLGLHIESCAMIKSKISEITNIVVEDIIISTTHTHSGPDVVDFFKNAISADCLVYLDTLAVKIAAFVKGLLTKVQDVNVFTGRSVIEGISFNRRLVMNDGQLKMNFEEFDPKDVIREAGPIDPELICLSLRAQDGTTMAVIVNYALHPAILVGKDFLWSRDYVNYIDLYLQDKIGKEVVMFFANGAEGNINHLNYKIRNQDRGFDECKRVGEIIGKKAVEAIVSGELVESDKIICISKMIDLPLRKISIIELKEAHQLLELSGDCIPSQLDGVPDVVYANEIIKLSRRDQTFAKTEIQLMSIGNTAILTLPGEVFTEFGLELKKCSDYKYTMIFGLTNDCIGYIPTENAFSEGGYEIIIASSSRLDKSAGAILVKEILSLLSGG